MGFNSENKMCKYNGNSTRHNNNTHIGLLISGFARAEYEMVKKKTLLIGLELQK